MRPIALVLLLVAGLAGCAARHKPSEPAAAPIAFDDLGTYHAHTEVIRVARVFGNDDLVPPFDVREGLTTLDIGAGDTGNCGETDSGLTTRRGDAPLRTGELGQLRADAVHHLVELDEVVGGLEHRLLHLRE